MIVVHARDTARAVTAIGVAIDRGARAALKEAGRRAKQQAKSTTRFEDQTGALRRSIGFVMSGAYHGEFSAAAPHALFVEAGTKPHIIEAKRAPMLRFKYLGNWVVKRSVQHPGTHATDFMRDSAEQANAGELVEYAVTAAIRSGD